MADADYEDQVKQHPTHTPTWLEYLRYTIKQEQDPQQLFERCLVQLNDVLLWRCYISFVLGKNSDDLNGSAYDTVCAAYEYVLQHVGLEYYSDSLWDEYIKYLTTYQSNNPDKDISEKIIDVYGRCCVIPLNNLDTLWRQFEDQFPAQKQERVAFYLNAKGKCKQLQQFVDAIPKHTLCKYPNRWDDYDKVLAKVQAWVDFESNNPLNYPDPRSCVVRACYAYTYAINNFMYYVPGVWIEYLSFCSTTHMTDLQLIAADAVKACPLSIQLTTVACELQHTYPEKFGCTTKKQVKNILDNCKSLFEELIKEYEAKLSKFKQEIIEAGQDESLVQNLQDQEQEYMALAIDAWIQYLRFMKRADDNAQKHTRLIFSRARKTAYAEQSDRASLLFQVSACLEYWAYDDKAVAFKIFEVGLGRFKDIEYVCTYFDHLLLSGDLNNARALFERMLTVLSVTDGIHLWRRMLAWEQLYGNLTTLRSLEQRFVQAYEVNPDYKWIGSRLCADMAEVYKNECGTEQLTFNYFTLKPSMLSSSGTAATKVPLKTSAVQLGDVFLPATKEQESAGNIVSDAITVTIDKENVVRPDIKHFKAFSSQGRPATSAPVPQRDFPQKKQEAAYQPPIMQQPASVTGMPAVDAFLQFFQPGAQFQGPLLQPDMVLDIIRNAPFQQPVGYRPGQLFGMQGSVAGSESGYSRTSKRQRK